eukprot:CAMPEP_0117420894 /NCGR_PEP_ID=MMETSP0758-20121206/2131_1 /TAXON_ID=63605 /ORGANISM="Percolomonas cosmopolitus, Strain AE-1 (ATCC 50343)" /LENGTH=210 /DNA_ID=CAMNT_0005202765 /DNA_START=200 /DNA_END=828 /DNA_ORIENTATION=-
MKYPNLVYSFPQQPTISHDIHGNMDMEKIANQYNNTLLKEQNELSKREDFAGDLADELLLLGIRDVFEQTPIATLRSICNELTSMTGNTKEKLTLKIFSTIYPTIEFFLKKKKVLKKPQSFIKTEKSEPTQQVKRPTDDEIRKNRLPIESYTTVQEILDNYWSNEISEKCKELGIRYKKMNVSIRDIINLIHHEKAPPRKRQLNTFAKKR